jgi:pyruvate formate-lyase/glycerol dehydratase family glycyl radical enzyme
MDRIKHLKHRYLGYTPELFPERALLVTQSYKENAGRPMVLLRALSFKHILENMTLFIEKGEPFLGNPSPRGRCPVVCPEFGAAWIARELDIFAKREADAIAVSEDNKTILKECLKFWQDKSVDFIAEGLMPEKAKKAIAHGMITVGGTGTAIGNIALDYPKVLDKGLDGIIQEIDRKIADFKAVRIKDVDRLNFWQASKIACRAVIDFAKRYAQLARKQAHQENDPEWKQELEIMADILERIPAGPAQTFREALQAIWLVYVAVHIESDPHAILLGRFDQYMYRFYQNDIEKGRITDEEVKDLLACLWIKCTSMIKLRDEASSKAFAGFPLFQNITAGGQTPSGKDATNELSYLMLDAAELAQTSQPSIGLRYHPKIPDKLMLRAAQVIRTGIGYPAIMNDDVIIPKHLLRGATMAEARDYCTNCVETDVPGKTDSRAHSGYVNFPKCLLLALNDGKDLETGARIGPETGRFDTFKEFKDFYQAYKTQIAFFIETIVEAYNIVDSIHAQVAPEPFLSSLIDDCIEKGETRQQGGAKYNFSGIFGVGLSVAVDSLAAVKKLVFDRGDIGPERLMAALTNNFEKDPLVQKLLLNKAPKFGNNDDYVDALAASFTSFFAQEVIRHPCIRGGFYIPELHSVATHVLFGEITGATPDGRNANIPFADGLSPVHGRDRSGPTAAVQSVTKIDHVEVLQGLLYNQKCHPTVLGSDEALKKFADYMAVFCELGGHHIQFNVVSQQTLLDAQKKPDQYKDLIVRVAGYSAYFTELNSSTQNEIIQRTELGI